MDEEETTTPLHDAISDKNLELVVELLSEGANPNAQEANQGNTPLHLLLQDEDPLEEDLHLYLLKILTEAGADVNGINYLGKTPLHDAISNQGSVAVVEHLLSCGADTNRGDASDNTPLHEVARQLREDESLLKLAELLLVNCADVNARSRRGFTPIHLLAQSDNVEATALFLKHQADVNLKDKSGDTAVNTAARCGNFEVMRLLVQHGAELNITDPKNASPLHWACSHNALKEVKFLFKHGANLNARDLAGCTPLMYTLKALKTGKDDLSQKRYETLVFLLKKWPEVNNVDFTGNNVLRIDSDKACRKVMVEHLAKLETMNLVVDPGLLETISQLYWYYFTDSGAYDINYYTLCTEELLLAKRTRVHQDYTVSFFDLLIKDDGKLVGYAGNEGLIDYFEMWDSEESFPIYGGVIQQRVEKAVSRRDLYDGAAEALANVLPLAVDPGHLVVRKILGFLEKRDLETLCKLDSE